MLEAYRIGISIALTNRVSSVLEVVAQDFANPRMPSPLPKAEILNLKEEALHKFLCLAARTALSRAVTKVSTSRATGNDIDPNRPFVRVTCDNYFLVSPVRQRLRRRKRRLMAAARWCRVSASVSAAGIERTITTASIPSLAGDIHDEFPSTPGRDTRRRELGRELVNTPSGGLPESALSIRDFTDPLAECPQHFQQRTLGARRPTGQKNWLSSPRS